MFHPTRIDSLMYVIRPKSWLALFALSAFVGIVLAWSIFATIPITVAGDGILLSPGGILEVVSSSQGRLKDYRVQAGDRIEQGQVVATIDQPELSQQLDEAVRERESLLGLKEKTLQLQSRFVSGRGRLSANRRKDLEDSLVGFRQQMSWLEQQGEGLQKLLERNIVPRSKLLDHMMEKGKVEQSIGKVQNELRQLEMEEEFEKIRVEKELLDLDGKINAFNIRIEGLTAALKRESEVISPYSGVVVELYTNVGEVTTRGTTLFSIVPKSDDAAQENGELVAIVYVSSADGKKVRKGMSAQVVPVIIKRTEYGGILGRVRTVADIPSSVEGMLHTLKNKALTTSLSGGSSPYEVRISLQPDDGNVTGYRWTSRAPNLVISPGTLCKVDITVNRIHPITLVIPALKPLLPDEIPQT